MQEQSVGTPNCSFPSEVSFYEQSAKVFFDHFPFFLQILFQPLGVTQNQWSL